MSQLRGAERSEVQLLRPCLDDYVAPEAPVRFIDAVGPSQDQRRADFEKWFEANMDDLLNDLILRKQ